MSDKTPPPLRIAVSPTAGWLPQQQPRSHSAWKVVGVIVIIVLALYLVSFIYKRMSCKGASGVQGLACTSLGLANRAADLVSSVLNLPIWALLSIGVGALALTQIPFSKESSAYKAIDAVKQPVEKAREKSGEKISEGITEPLSPAADVTPVIPTPTPTPGPEPGPGPEPEPPEPEPFEPVEG